VSTGISFRVSGAQDLVVILTIALVGIRAHSLLPLASSSTLRGRRVRYSRCLRSAIRCDEGQLGRAPISFLPCNDEAVNGRRPAFDRKG